MPHRRTRSQEKMAAVQEEAELLEAAQAQTAEEEQIRARLPREVLNTNRRLDHLQHSFDLLQSHASRLKEMVAQIGAALGKQPAPGTAPNSPTPSPKPATTTQSAASVSNEFYGVLSLQSSLCGRPKQQQHKEGGSGGDLTMGTNTSATSINGKNLVDKQPGPEILSMDHASSNHHFAPEQSQVLDLDKSNGWQPEFQQGATSDSPALHVFGEMPIPHSLHGTHAIAPEYSNCSYCHHAPIPSSCVQGGSTILSEQIVDGIPQAYGFHNLNRHSLFLSDGSEHSYFALPDNYPLERALPEPVFDVYDDEIDVCSTELVDVLAGIRVQQTYEENQQESVQLAKCFGRESESTSSEQVQVLKPLFEQLLRDFSKAPETEQTIADVLDSTFGQQQQNDEKASTNVQQLRDPQLTVLVIHERRREWDPGATAFPVTPLNNDNNNDTIVVFNEAVLDIPPAKPPEKYDTAGSSLVNVRLRDPQLNTLVIHVRRKEWDPGALLLLMMSSKNQHCNQALQPATHATILAGSSVTRFSECKCLPFWVHNNISMLITESCPLRCLWEFSVSCTTLKLQFGVPIDVPQYSCYYRGPSSQENYGIQFLWDPGILSLMHMMLGKTVVPNQVHSRQTPCTLLIRLGQPIDLNKFWAHQLQYHSWSHTLNDFLQVQYGFLPIVLDCPYSEPTLQLVCYSSMFNSTNTFHSANAMSTATAMRMILILSYQKIAEEDKDVAAVYQIFEIRLPKSKSSIIWDPKDTVPISCCNMPTSTCFSALRFVDLLLRREKAQWDPEIGTPSSIYLWMQGLTARMETKKPVYLSQTPEPPTWQRQVTSGFKQWSFWCNAMLYCQIFQRCTTVSSRFDFLGIPLWLINFQVP